jgi:predicted transcriptional regulator
MSPEKNKHPFEHRYFTSYPVDSEKTASWFSKKITYSIMDLLWEAGPRGLTPSEVFDFLKERRHNVSRTVVYQTLRGLYENEKVEREWDKTVEANRNVLTERSLPAILDDDFVEWAESDLKDKIETVLFPAFESYLSQVMKLANEKKVSDDFIPKKGKDGWCHRCDTSHEAEFFFLALLYHAAYTFVYSPDDWKFADKVLGNKIAKLYADNKLADPKELFRVEDS